MQPASAMLHLKVRFAKLGLIQKKKYWWCNFVACNFLNTTLGHDCQKILQLISCRKHVVKRLHATKMHRVAFTTKTKCLK